MNTTTEDKQLSLASAELISKELAFADPSTIVADSADEGLSRQADDLIERLCAISPTDTREQQRQTGAVQSLGHKVQAEIGRRSALLKTTMGQLMQDAEDGGPVAQGLLKLQEEVSDINPNQYEFRLSGLRKLIAKLPGVGTPLSRWIARYQSVESVIQQVVQSLETGKSRLERDNVTLQDDQSVMRELTLKLESYVKFGQLLDQRLEARLNSAPKPGEAQLKFLQEEIQFPLRQRILDIQQQLGVNQQGVLTTEVIVRNNRELIRGVGRALNVTVPALNNAATLALALQTQKNVLDGVQAVTDTTNELIVQTADKLKTQGAAIQKQASSTMLDIDKLKTAFSDVETALEDISRFRRDALPQMAHSIVEMNELTGKMEHAIQDVEQGRAARDAFELEITAT